jgi:hypothetical protein
MRLSRFNQYRDLVNESRIYLLPTFRVALKSIANSDDTGISKEILGLEGRDIDPDLTLIGIDSDGWVTFVQMDRAKKIIQKEFGIDIQNWDEESLKKLEDLLGSSGDDKKIEFIDKLWTEIPSVNRRSTILNGVDNLVPLHNIFFNTTRNSTTIGRFVRGVLGDKSDKDIERFTNLWKSTITSSGGEFKIFSGRDIVKWYDSSNIKVRGTLSGSCMNFNISGNYLDLYIENPDKVALLVWVDSGGVYQGRALVWKVNHPQFKYLMDRIYYGDDSTIDVFKRWAKSKGWGWKTHQSHSKWGEITWSGGQFTDLKLSISGMRVPQKFPYLDTFQFMDAKTGEFKNWKSETTTHQFSDTRGGYVQLKRYSRTLDSYLDTDDSVWVSGLGDWVRNNMVVRNPGGDMILKTDAVQIWGDEWEHKDNIVYSKWKGAPLSKSNSVEVIIDVEGNTDWYPKFEMNTYYHKCGNRYLIKSLTVFDDINREYISKEDSMEIKYYETEDRDNIWMDDWGWKTINRFKPGFFGKVNYEGVTKKLGERDIIWEKFTQKINPYWWMSELERLGDRDFIKLRDIIKSNMEPSLELKWIWENYNREFIKWDDLIRDIRAVFYYIWPRIESKFYKLEEYGGDLRLTPEEGFVLFSANFINYVEWMGLNNITDYYREILGDEKTNYYFRKFSEIIYKFFDDEYIKDLMILVKIENRRIYKK